MRVWARNLAAVTPGVRRVGYFGSYARGDWGVGSDLDLVVVMDAVDEPLERRAARFDTTELPVPVDLLVYTAEEWERLASGSRRFVEAIRHETVWVVERGT